MDRLPAQFSLASALHRLATTRPARTPSGSAGNPPTRSLRIVPPAPITCGLERWLPLPSGCRAVRGVVAVSSESDHNAPARLTFAAVDAPIACQFQLGHFGGAPLSVNVRNLWNFGP